MKFVSARLPGVALALLLFGTAALAEKSLDPLLDLKVKFKETCEGTVHEYKLGKLSATVRNGDGANPGLKTKLTIDKSIESVPKGFFSCMEIHFYQMITRDDSPSPYKGKTDYPHPIVDGPPKGWDYMYKDGAARTMPYDDDTNGRYKDDAADEDPWYHTKEEEAGAAGSGNENGGFGKFKIGESYEMFDGLGGLPDPKLIKFTCWVVATPKNNWCPDGCVKKGQFVLLGGFDWTMAKKEENISIAATALKAADAQKGLDNASAKFPGWTALDSGVFCCPEPGTYAAMALGLAAVAIRRRRK